MANSGIIWELSGFLTDNLPRGFVMTLSLPRLVGMLDGFESTTRITCLSQHCVHVRCIHVAYVLVAERKCDL